MLHSPFASAPRPALAAGLNTYRQVSVDSLVLGSDPHGLVRLLFEGLVDALAQARVAMQSGLQAQKARALDRALRILGDGLRANLNLEAGGKLAQDLDQLYGYLAMQLTLANLRNDEAALLTCQRLVQPLQEAWLAIGQTAPARSA
jgi:flagellar protein FliS